MSLDSNNWIDLLQKTFKPKQLHKSRLSYYNVKTRLDDLGNLC